MNADVYVEKVLIPYVIPYASFIEEGFIFMQDDARPHVARRVLDYCREIGINLLEWPAINPNLNSIKHLWGNLGRKVRNYVPALLSLPELRRVLETEWANITQAEIQTLIRSMPRRMEKVICARGGHTHY
ncbi:transposable element tc3 transposase [Lasius niger]|uniref:Transposable element tc3 transposase n=1 Tax=Lasius niger TaxID=67767 RepID=A0A0J7N2U1_LASNI|nr:transposable element tc3 transposase [Lasius niger]